MSYRFRGVNPHGQPVQGRIATLSLAGLVREYFDKGWRSLVVCAGDGPVPPPLVGAADLVGEICKHPDTGRRVWWSEP